jgi:hypothetical protein
MNEMAVMRAVALTTCGNNLIETRASDSITSTVSLRVRPPSTIRHHSLVFANRDLGRLEFEIQKYIQYCVSILIFNREICGI